MLHAMCYIHIYIYIHIHIYIYTHIHICILSHISQSYDGGRSFIMKDLEFLIQDKPDRGQFVAILGMSGCGKSTLLRYIAGLQQPTTGEVFLDGKIRNPDERVSMVFQQYSSLPWMTVLENVTLGLRYQGISKLEREEKATLWKEMQ